MHDLQHLVQRDGRQVALLTIVLARTEVAKLVDSLIDLLQAGHIYLFVDFLHDLRVLLIVEAHHVHSVVRVIIVIV